MALLLVQLLTGSRDPDPRDVSEGYAARDAAESAVELLHGLSRDSGARGEVLRFLLANDFAELGWIEQSEAWFDGLQSSAVIGDAAFVALLRARAELGREEQTLEDARHGPWEYLRGEDFAESAYRVAGAALRARRFGEAREWARSVPADSSFFPFARVLISQAELASERPSGAADAVLPVFARDSSLGERAAVLLGEAWIDAGWYRSAEQVLLWPSADGGFGRRAERARRIAAILAAAERGDLAAANVEIAAFDRTIEHLASGIRSSVATPEARRARIAALRRHWPPRDLLQSRRAWAARHAAAALAEIEGWSARRAARTLWRSLPPVALHRLAASATGAGDTADPGPLDSESRFFFAPDPSLARALSAIALVDDRLAQSSSEARALRVRVASALVGEAAAPSIHELSNGVASGGEGDAARVLSLVERRASHALVEAARRLERDLLRRRWLVGRAVAGAELRRHSALQAARSSAP